MATLEFTTNGNTLTLGKQNFNVEEVYVGESAPADDKGYKVWVNPAEMPDFIVTMEEVEAEVARQLDGKDLDLSDYYNKTEVDAKIASIELLEGPQGEQGPQGEAGKDGKDGANGTDGEDGYTPIRGTDYWTEEDKSEIVSDVLAAIPAAEGVEV